MTGETGSAPADALDEVDEVDEIRLTLPALVPYARVARLAITGLASRSGFTYDEVEDLRIATGEAFGVLIGSAQRIEQITFTCRLHPGALEVAAQRIPAAPLAEVPALSEQILAAVVDQVRFDRAAGAIRTIKHQQILR